MSTQRDDEILAAVNAAFRALADLTPSFHKRMEAAARKWGERTVYIESVP
jgi:hypothetical protein